MYKITNQLTNSHLIMVRKKLADGSTAAFVFMGQPHRLASTAHFDPNKCPPPAPPKPKSRKLFWTTVGTVVLTGSAAVYAKNNQDIRNWLATNAPWADKFIGVVYRENTTYSEFADKQLSKGTEKVKNFLFGKEGVEPIHAPSKALQNLEEDAKKQYAPKDYILPPYRLGPLYVEEEPAAGTPDVEHEAMLVQTEKVDPAPPVEVKITMEVVELEEQAHKNTKAAVDSYKAALVACQKFNKALFKIVEAKLEDLDSKSFATIKATKDARDTAHEAACEAVIKAKAAIKELESLLSSGSVKAPPDAVVQTSRFIQQFKRDIESVEKAYCEELEKANLSEKYWHKVNEARQYFKKELEAIYPGIDLTAKDSLELKTDTDLLLIHMMNITQYLNKEIAELQYVRDQKLTRAVDCNDPAKLMDLKIDDAVLKEKVNLEKDFLLKSLQLEADANRKLREAIKKQMELNQEVLASALKTKEAEISAQQKKKSSEQIEKIRLETKQKLAAIIGKMNAIEQTLKQRAQVEEQARKSQSLWTAAEALLAATRKKDDVAKIDNEVKALEQAGKGDKVVATVLKGIPNEAREKGITTEKTLKERFDQLEKSALKVALVGREGASLITYFLSWLQSKLVFHTLAEIPEDELNNKPTDFTKLDTFEIMQRARYFMDQGELATVLRYVNLLQGAARAAAQPWTEDARRHLEVKQAAEVVMAHATATGMAHS